MIKYGKSIDFFEFVMENANQVSNDRLQASQEAQNQLPEAETENLRLFWLKKLRGSALLVIGYLLSPLSCWNDLFFNLPIGYLFGYICSWLSPALLLPCTLVGYWGSNLVGILLMQVGAVEVLQGQSKPRHLKKELLMGLASSTAYTLVILALIQFKIIDPSAFFPSKDPLQFTSFLPIGFLKHLFG